MESVVEIAIPKSQTYAITPTAAPAALVIRCFDPRFQKPTDLFLEHELNLPRGSYVDFVIAGGVASFSEVLRLPKDFRFMRQNAEFILQNFKTLERIILISHEDCKKYQALSEVLRFAVEYVPERQRNDLTEVSRTIAVIAGHMIEVRRFYARFANSVSTEVTFEEQK
jgi:hypothetical protein